MDEIIEFTKDMFKYMLIIGIVILVRIFVLTTTEVVGPSMEPNLNDNDILLVDQLTPKIKGYSRFDIVVFESSSSCLTKRIIGLPGETIKYKDDKLYINEKIVEEKFDKKDFTDDLNEVMVPTDSYFVMGDNRSKSTDSRNFGSIGVKKIIGKPFFRIWPFDNINIVK